MCERHTGHSKDLFHTEVYMGQVVLYVCTSNRPVTIHLSKQICPHINHQNIREFCTVHQKWKNQTKENSWGGVECGEMGEGVQIQHWRSVIRP